MDAIVDELRRVLRSRPEVRVAILFGSRARGTANERSDVDVALRGTRLDRMAIAAELALAVRREVDVVDVDEAGYPLLQAIVRDGIVVHEARRGLAASWRAHALCDLETDRSGWVRMRDSQLRRAAGG